MNLNKSLPTKLDKIRDKGRFYLPNFATNLINRIKLNNPILISGPTGCGKTELIELLAKFFEIKLFEIDFSVGVTESNIIGRILVENGETVFHYGMLPKAMKEGGWILLDEIDFAEPEHLSIMQSVLTGKPLIITQNKSEVIEPHPDFRIFATANTKGRGDETQSYAGTNVLNISFIDRFSIFEMDYTKYEEDIMNDFIGDSELVTKFNELFKLFRKATSNDEIINASFSTRRLIQLVKLMNIGESLSDALTYEIIDRFEESEKPLIKEYIYEIFDKEHYLKNWSLGDTHFIPLVDDQVIPQT